MGWRNAFREGRELVLATCSEDARPNANIVMSLGFVDDRLLIADSQMETTIKNMKSTKRICVVSRSDGEYYRIKGSVEVHSSGKYLDICNSKDKQYPTKNAILVSIEEVFDLDKVRKIEI